MSHIYFVKDGCGDHHTSDAHEIPFAVLCDKLRDREVKFFANGPTVNPERGVARWCDAYKHVVVETIDGETSAMFPKRGYYYVLALSPTECRQIFGIAE